MIKYDASVHMNKKVIKINKGDFAKEVKFTRKLLTYFHRSQYSQVLNWARVVSV